MGLTPAEQPVVRRAVVAYQMKKEHKGTFVAQVVADGDRLAEHNCVDGDIGSALRASTGRM